MRLRSLVPLAGIVSLLALPAHAAIFVSDVEASGTAPNLTLHYLLNEAAATGSITVATAAAPDTALQTIPLTGDQLAQGPHDVALDTTGLAAGDYVYKVNVTAAPHTGYDIIVPVTPVDNAQTLSYGLKFNKVPGSLGYGHIFASDYTAHLVHELNAAGQYVQGNAVPSTGDFTPVGIAIDNIGDYYVTDQNVDHIYQFHASGSTIKPTWSQVADFAGLPVGEFGSFTGRDLQVFGTGADAVAYIAAYTPVPNPVLRGRLGDTENAPEVLFDGASIAGTRIDDLLVTDDQKTVYVVSGAAGTSHLNKYIYAPDIFTQELVWQLDPDFIQNVPETATLTGRSRGVALSQDGKYLWVTQSIQSGGQDVNYIAKVALEPQTTDPATAARVLRIAGGLTEAPLDTWFALDLDGDGSITVADAVGAIRQPSPAGTVVARIPTPILEGAATPVLPFTLGTDPKGNLAVGVNTIDSTPIVGTAFYILALPDEGSADTATSRTFTLAG